MAGRGRVSKLNILKNIEDMENNGPIAKARQKILDSIFTRFEFGRGCNRSFLEEEKETDVPVVTTTQAEVTSCQEVLDTPIITKIVLGRGRARGRGLGRGHGFLTSLTEDLPGLELNNLNQSNDVNIPEREGQFNNCEPEEGRGRGGCAKQIPTPAPSHSSQGLNEWDIGDEDAEDSLREFPPMFPVKEGGDPASGARMRLRGTGEARQLAILRDNEVVTAVHETGPPIKTVMKSDLKLLQIQGLKKKNEEIKTVPTYFPKLL